MGEDWLRTGIGRSTPDAITAAGLIGHLAEEMTDPIGLRLRLDVEHRATYTGSRRADRGDTPPGYTAESPDG